jgi:formylglycine-generating enzyme required for sulfatase activity
MSNITTPSENLDLFRFIKITSQAMPQPFWISKYPVTNSQYERFLKAKDYANPDFWTGFQKFDENCKLMGDWGDEGLKWLKEQLKNHDSFPPELWKDEPRLWSDPTTGLSGIAKPDNPVVGVSWFEANAYGKWLAAHWNNLSELRANPDLKPALLRLPLETEWVAAAGGEKPAGRYPWDLPGKKMLCVSLVRGILFLPRRIRHFLPAGGHLV